MNTESIRKTLKTFNLTTTIAILMKRTAIMYLDESVNRKPVIARNSVFCCNVYCRTCHALPCAALLVKFSYKFHEKPPKISPK